MSRVVSIERRVVRSFVRLTLLVAMFYAAFAVMIAYIIEDAVIGAMLDDEVRYLERTHADTGTLGGPRLGYIALYPDAGLTPEPVRARLAGHPDEREVFTDDERHYHLRRLDLSDGSRPWLVAEVSPLLVVTHASANLSVLLLAAFVLVMGLTLWLAYRIARQTTLPIVQLSDEVRRGQHAHHELALSAAGHGDEVGYLADTIQTTVNDLNRALERESHFTRDVSHELRTPLTVMRNTLSLTGQRPARPADIEQLRAAVDRMQATVTTLLGLAREESVQAQAVRLRAIVEESIIGMHARLDETRFSVDVSVPEHLEVRGNAHLISLLVTNLVENAVRYSATPRLHIALQSDELRFSNEIAVPVPGDVTASSRRQADSEGLGQGLFLVKRIAETLQWQLRTRTEGRLFSVILRFPAGGEQPAVSP